MDYTVHGVAESDTTERAHTTLPLQFVLGRTRNYSVLLDVSLVVKTKL